MSQQRWLQLYNMFTNKSFGGSRNSKKMGLVNVLRHLACYWLLVLPFFHRKGEKICTVIEGQQPEMYHFCKRTSISNWSTRPTTFQAGSDYCIHTCCPYVRPHFTKSTKNKTNLYCWLSGSLIYVKTGSTGMELTHDYNDMFIILWTQESKRQQIHDDMYNNMDICEKLYLFYTKRQMKE